jgi:general secretion pathway protein K
MHIRFAGLGGLPSPGGRAWTDRGAALLMVLWVLMLLTVIVGEFCYSMRTRVNITRNLKETTQAYYIAVAGLNTAIFKMVEQQLMPPPAASTDDDTQEETAVALRVNTDIPPVPFGEGEFKVWIENEAGKININQADQRVLQMMLAGFDLDDQQKAGIVDSILDWRDADDLHRLNGAEDDYYASLPNPYECKDADFESVEELLLVKGVTPEIFYGGLEDMITVFAADSSKTGRRTSRTRRASKTAGYGLNINAISPQLWASLPGMTEEAITAITEYRKEKDFRSVAELRELVGPDVYVAVSRYLSVETLPYYTVRSIGLISGSRNMEGVAALIHIDSRADRKFRVIKWEDSVFHSIQGDDRPSGAGARKEGD